MISLDQNRTRTRTRTHAHYCYSIHMRKHARIRPRTHARTSKKLCDRTIAGARIARKHARNSNNIRNHGLEQLVVHQLCVSMQCTERLFDEARAFVNEQTQCAQARARPRPGTTRIAHGRIQNHGQKRGCKRMRLDASGCKLIQADASGCQLTRMQADVNSRGCKGCTWMQAGKLMQADTSE